MNLSKELEKKVKGNKIELYKLRTQSQLSGQSSREAVRALKKQIARDLTQANKEKK